MERNLTSTPRTRARVQARRKNVALREEPIANKTKAFKRAVKGPSVAWRSTTTRSTKAIRTAPPTPASAASPSARRSRQTLRSRVAAARSPLPACAWSTTAMRRARTLARTAGVPASGKTVDLARPAGIDADSVGSTGLWKSGTATPAAPPPAGAARPRGRRRRSRWARSRSHCAACRNEVLERSDDDHVTAVALCNSARRKLFKKPKIN